MAIKSVSRVRVAALILSCVAAVLALTPGAAGAQTVATQRASPADALAGHMRILATDPRNFYALIGAGKAALELGDTQAAAGFYGRAEEVWAASPMPKAGMGAALAHDGDAAAALQYFAQAAQLGATVATFGLERGLAFDLLGRHAEAQADYRAVLAGADGDEARRRLSLSLAISGNKADAISLLGPLMARGDAAAARVRAFVLALSGDPDGARVAIEAAMPGSSYRMDPFFRRLPALRSDQKAAAVHLGMFPGGSQPGVAIAATGGDRLKSIEELLGAGSSPPPAPRPKVETPAQRPSATPGRPVQVASAAASRPTSVSTRRFWVQLASGPNADALPGEFRRIKRRNREALADLSPYVADEASRSRLLIGPFKDKDAATEFAEGLESDGVSAFSWTAPPGQTVRKLPSE